MDNLKIQLTPLEVTYQSKDALPLSCVLKKVVISTGQLLQKRQIKSNSHISVGRVNFTEGTTFALSKEMEMANTRISMHFMAKKDRNISCIGSAELDVATIPNATFSLIELKLSNCSDPRGKLKLQIQRKQEKIDMKKDKQRIQNVGLLLTEGVQRESLLMNRRTNTNMPTAYEISRRNYAEIVRDEKNSESRKHGSSKGSKGSYQKKFQTATAMTNQSRSKNKRNEMKTHQELPMPRANTPEPISIESSRKTGCIVNNNIEPSKHSIAGRAANYQEGLRTKNIGSKGHEERWEQPSSLVIKPHQQRQRSYTEAHNDENVCDNSHYKLEQQKNSKYRLITEKLQMIHDKIVTGQSKDVSEAGIEQSIRSQQQHGSIRSNQQHQSYSQQVNSSLQMNTAGNVQHVYNQTQRRQNTYQKPHSHSGTFKPFKTDSQSREDDLIDAQQQHIPKLSTNSLEFKEQSGKKREVQVEQKSQNKFANIPGWSISNQWHNSPKSTLKTSPDEREKTKIETDSRQLRELQKENEQLTKRSDSYLSQISNYQRQIAQLKDDIVKNSLLLKQKDQQIYQLTNKICESDKSLIQKQALLDKINNDYDAKFDEVQNLREQLADIQYRQQGSIIDKIKDIPRGSTQGNRESTSSNSALVQEELLQTKKRLSEVQVQLRSRQNELKLFKIQMDDMRVQKRGLEQQIQSFYKKNFKQLSRQRSIALIQEASVSNGNLILQNTKRENDALKQEIKLLQQHKQAIHRQLQVNKNSVNENRSVAGENRGQWQTKYEERIICLQERCRLLEEELKNKKNVMAEMVNIIWNHGDADIMNQITQLMGSE